MDLLRRGIYGKSFRDLMINFPSKKTIKSDDPITAYAALGSKLPAFPASVNGPVPPRVNSFTFPTFSSFGDS